MHGRVGISHEFVEFDYVRKLITRAGCGDEFVAMKISRFPGRAVFFQIVDRSIDPKTDFTKVQGQRLGRFRPTEVNRDPAPLQ